MLHASSTSQDIRLHGQEPQTVEVARIEEAPEKLARLRRGDAVFVHGWCLELGGGVLGLDDDGQPVQTRRVWATGPRGQFEGFRGYAGAEFRRLVAFVNSSDKEAIRRAL